VRGRVIAVVSAIVLAGVGALLLTGYVSRADERAMAGVESTSVLVVVEPIAEGTPVSAMAGLVSVEKYPLVAVAPGALASLDDVAGMVATTDLQPGEQILASRLADPASLLAPGEVAVPEGMQSVSVQLTPERVVGGRLAAGDTVGVLVSLTGPERTHLVLQKVLVVRVQGAAVGSSGEDGAEPVPSGSVIVTLAVSAADAEKVVFAAEHGSIWLSDEPESASTGGTRVVTEEDVLG
jgi:pilus assembly protein CpaB